MRLWRISNHLELSGRGGLLSPGRWHRLGTPVIYCSDHPATTLLEMLVHTTRRYMPPTFQLLLINVPDHSPKSEIVIQELPRGWQTNVEITQEIGTRLLGRAEHLLIRVPCAILPQASNILLNAAHPTIAECAIEEAIQQPLDLRLVV